MSGPRVPLDDQAAQNLAWLAGTVEERVTASSRAGNRQASIERARAKISEAFSESRRPDMRGASEMPLNWEAERVTEMNQLTPELGGPTPNSMISSHMVLLRMDGPQAGEVHSVPRGEVIIGRHPKCGVSVDDTGISRQHARLHVTESGCAIEDMGSLNGTYVRGQRIERVVLRDGDWLQLGPRVGFRFTTVDTRQEQLLRRLYDSSNRDALTGVYNRKHLNERLRAEIAFATRHAAEMALVMLDIDYFKRVNDVHGHSAGDAVLRHVARLLGTCLRTEDILARFGGEEFALVLRGTDLDGAGRLAERLRVRVQQAPAEHEGVVIPCTISLGCATTIECANVTAENLIGVADRRLYKAKELGRNRVVTVD